MADAEGDHEEYVRAVQYNEDWFRVRPVDTEQVWSVKWQRHGPRVTYRTGGTTGTVEVEGELRRIHVCSLPMHQSPQGFKAEGWGSTAAACAAR